MSGANKKASNETVGLFLRAVYPEMTELATAANTEETCLRDATEIIIAARAELAAKDAEIEQLREALGEIDRVWEEDLTGEIPYIVTNALSSLPPSDMRLVPVEVLKKIDLVAREAICGAASGNLLLEVVAKALGTHPNCAPSNMAVVLVERLREIEWCLPGPGGQRCPVCCYMRDGHAPDCWLAAAIRDAEREKA